MIDPKDGGVRSRKMWFAAGVGIVMVLCWLATGFLLPLASTFDALIGGLLAITGLYITGNVANKYAIIKNSPKVSFAGEQWDSSASSPAPAPSQSKTAAKPPALPKAPKKDDGVTEEGG